MERGLPFFGAGVSWTITIIVIRLLSPGDYGMAMLLIDREELKETMELIRAWQLIPSHDV